MVTKRSYFSIVILMAVITFLFLLPKIFEDYSIKYHNRNIETHVLEEMGDVVGNDTLEMTSDINAIAGRKLVYILADTSDTQSVSLISEWCVYRKFHYRVINSLEKYSEEIPDFIVLGDFKYTESMNSILRSYLAVGTNIIFTQMPDYSDVESHKEYMDLLGIMACRQESVDIEELHIFNDFFVSKERLYSNKDFYGDKGKFKLEIPYYELRTGYQVFAQGKVKDVKYLEYPPLLWRTYTDKGYVFVVNTDLFEGKSLLGVLTAFVSQCDTYDVYPVVNAQTVSVINFPVLKNENEEMFEETYDRDMYSFSRDILWPGVSAILQNYNKSYNFFMAPKLDYSKEDMTDNPDIAYYYSEIITKLGTLGVSYDQVSEEPLETIKETLDKAVSESVDSYVQTAAYVPKDKLEDTDSIISESTNIIVTDMSEDLPVFEKTDNGYMRVSFTSSGLRHDMQEDLSLISMETALGLDMQSTNMMDVLFKNDDTYWEKVSSKWASEKTYLNDFVKFDTISVEESMVRFSNFLMLDYKAERLPDGNLNIHITSGNNKGYFIIRLWNEKITKVSSGSFEQINDTTYLVSVVDKDTVIYTKNRK